MTNELEATLGHVFATPRLLEEALTHSSAPRDRRGRQASYERLEFLGDRVLALVVAEMLLKRFPAEAEGALARRLTQLVRKETLAAVAGELDLARHVRLSLIEEPAARSNAGLLADVCEALIGALYLDGGFDIARGFIGKHWTPRMEAAVAPPTDPKTALQEWAQARTRPLPVYRLLATEGPQHRPVFTVSVEVDGLDVATAAGASKRLAEAGAAAALLERIATGEGA